MGHPLEMQHIEYVVEARTTETAVGVVPGWDMKDRDDPSKNTHLWIVLQALEMVHRLSGWRGAAAQAVWELALDHSADLHQGIWDADFVSPYNDLGWAFHFYDPDTHRNWLDPTLYPEKCLETARYWGALCEMSSWRAYQSGDLSTAAYQLGLALHFLTDVGQPMHAANFTSKDRPYLYHSGFEAYVLDWTNQTQPQPIPYVQTISASSIMGYIQWLAELSKPRNAILTSDDAKRYWNAYFSEDRRWQALVGPQIDGALRDVRSITAQYLLFWAQEALARLPAHTWSLTDITRRSQAPEAVPAGIVSIGRPEEIVFFVDERNHVHAVSSPSDDAWHDRDLTSAPGAPQPAQPWLTASVAPADDAADPGAAVSFVSSDQHVHAFLRSADPAANWEHHDLTSEAHDVLPATDTVVANATGFVASEQVVFQDADGYFRALMRVRGASWGDLNLTATTGATPGDAAAFTAFANDVAMWTGVYYLDSQFHVRELGGVQTVDQPWGPPFVGGADLTRISKAGAANGALIASSGWTAGLTKQVAYFGQDGHVYELSCPFDPQDGGWLPTDLSAAADAPVLDVIALVSFESQGTKSKHVALLDRGGHVHLLSYGPLPPWKYLDLTMSFGAPLAAGTALAAFAHQLPTRLGVLYVDTEGHVQTFTARPANSGMSPTAAAS